MLVEKGDLDWATTLGDALPDIRMHADVRAITLEQLLQHRSGLDRDIPDGLFEKLRLGRERPATQRERLAREILKSPPKHKPDSTFEYSNAGYTFAGLMLERRTRTPWEKLITEKLFAPLGMKSAGFGPPAKNAGDLGQPWGHTDDGKPVEPGPGSDNIPAIGPAGTAHMTLRDLARYGQWHLRENGPINPPLIKPGSLRFLHGDGKPDGYFFGWNRLERGWAGGQALSHSGSNTMFQAVIWLAPARDFGMVAAANQGGDKAAQACDALAGLAIERFCINRRAPPAASDDRPPSER
jgi:CubicO group peptidase (beta-lactamase class C family)